jgi:hypothetical protein
MRPTDDAGMTLIELLISISVLMLIIGPITLVLQFGLATANSATHRTTDSAGAQLLSSYFVADVQTSGFVWSATSPTSFASAPRNNQCGGSNTRLEMQWADALTGVINAVTYDVVPGAGTSDTALARRSWAVPPAPASCAQEDSTTLVASIDPTKLPTVTCLPSCAAASSVRLHVDALSQQVHNSTVYSGYSFDLTGSRRVS